MPEQKKKQESCLTKILISFGVLLVIIVIAVVVESGLKSSNSKTIFPTSSKFNVDDIYNQLNVGMSEADVEKIITQKPISCTESKMQGVGTISACTYGKVFVDSGSITVEYMNGNVYSKTKSQY